VTYLKWLTFEDQSERNMTIGVAQFQPIKGDIEANIRIHERLIGQAAESGVAALFFPELSLTGYEPELASQLVMPHDDPRLSIFHRLSMQHTMLVGVGAPTKLPSGIGISLLIFQPNEPLLVYSKQQLHADELPYFVAGNEQVMFGAGGLVIAPAICYESLQPSHAAVAAVLGATAYVACVAKSQAGLTKAYRHYPAVARAYSMPVLMANCTGHCDNFTAAGQSAVWNANGELVGTLTDTEEGLLTTDV
jgi:predicted amidohydrolase